MEISTKQLRVQPGRIISMVKSGQDVTVTFRGKPSVKIIPINKNYIVNTKTLKTDNSVIGTIACPNYNKANKVCIVSIICAVRG